MVEMAYSKKAFGVDLLDLLFYLIFVLSRDVHENLFRRFLVLDEGDLC